VGGELSGVTWRTDLLGGRRGRHISIVVRSIIKFEFLQVPWSNVQYLEVHGKPLAVARSNILQEKAEISKSDLRS
jgi:hypothetical protein